MEHSGEHSESKSDVRTLLALNEYTKTLSSDLKTSEDTFTGNQVKLHSLKETQWKMKHKIQNLMSYHEFLTQQKKQPEQWLTGKQLSQKSSEILQEYKNEKENYKNLSEKHKSLGNTLQIAEAVSQSNEGIEFELGEIEKKREKLDRLKKKFSTKHPVFENLCETEEETDDLIQKLKDEVEQKKKLVALLKKNSEIHEEETECEEILLKDMEKFIGTVDQMCCEDTDDISQIDSLTSRLMGQEE